jgi:hypothetical protein
MSIRGFSSVVVIACLMLTVWGCSRPNIVGTDAAVYSRGALYAVSGKDLNSVYAATVKALEQLEIEVVEKEKDVFYAKVVGEIADGMNVVVRLEPGDNNVTELSIKASALGNEDRSRVIYKKIQEILGTGAGGK